MRWQLVASSLLILTLLLASCATDTSVISTPTPIARYTSEVVIIAEDPVSAEGGITDEETVGTDSVDDEVVDEESAGLEEEVGDVLAEEAADTNFATEGAVTEDGAREDEGDTDNRTDGGFLDEQLSEEDVEIAEGEADEPGEIEIVEPAVISPDTVTPPGVSNAIGVVIEASNLIGKNVVSLNGRNLGVFDELIIDMTSGQLLFTTVTYGGMLELGDRTAPVPLPALHWQAETSTLAVDLPSGTMAAVGSFGDNWPNLGRPGWDSRLFAAWRQVDLDWIALSQLDNMRFVPGTIVKAGELMGKRVLDLGGEQLATVDDLLINLETGEVTYLILAQGGVLGIGGSRYAVPLSDFDLDLIGDDIRQSALILTSPIEDLPNALPYEDMAGL